MKSAGGNLKLKTPAGVGPKKDNSANVGGNAHMSAGKEKAQGVAKSGNGKKSKFLK